MAKSHNGHQETHETDAAYLPLDTKLDALLTFIGYKS